MQNPFYFGGLSGFTPRTHLKGLVYIEEKNSATHRNLIKNRVYYKPLIVQIHFKIQYFPLNFK